LEKVKEMDKFLSALNQAKLYEEDINHLSKSIISNELKAAMNTLPQKEEPRA
jgi:hypothetical protein